jgi:7-cyano-7-deazaguanine synthase in queuosine biosynthesis
MYDAILLFSGGIDSTYVAYDYLTRNKNKQLLIHHIDLKNKQNRAFCENQACNNIVKYFRDNGIENFFYSKSTFDYGDIQFLIYDIEIVAFTIYILASNPVYKNIKTILLPFYMNKSQDRYDKFFNILNLTGKHFNFVFPIQDMSKKQVIDKLPSDLLKLTWYCRTPINNKPCNVCSTCVEVRNTTIIE